MANIPYGAFEMWKNGETLRAEDWVKEREMLRVQGNDNFNRIKTLESSAANLRLSDNFAEPTTSASGYPLGNSVFKATGNVWNNYLGLSGAGIFVQTNKDSVGNAFQFIQTMTSKSRLFVRNSFEGAWLQAVEVPSKEDVQAQKITTDNGGVKFSVSSDGDLLQAILNEGIGFHTFYAASGAKNIPPDGISVRGIAHITGTNFGYVWAIDYRNQMWVNYINGTNGWLGWKELTTTNQNVLWSGAQYPFSTQTIYPTKKLSECRNGWVLVWSDYDRPITTTNNYHWNLSYIPKKVVELHPNFNFYESMATYMTTEAVHYANKTLDIRNDRIIGNDLNRDAPNSDDVVLRYVLEW